LFASLINAVNLDVDSSESLDHSMLDAAILRADQDETQLDYDATHLSTSKEGGMCVDELVMLLSYIHN